MTNQQGDVLLCQTNDNGEIKVFNGVVTMSSGLDTAAYLSLFGGNELDNKTTDNQDSWWGNFLENETSKKYVSETQFLLRSIPITSSNLLRINEAVKRDLQWFLNEKIASSIDSEVSIVGLNKISINIDILANGIESNFNFVENWKEST